MSEHSLSTMTKTAVFDALAAAGVTIVTVRFDGCGDSGQIEDIEAKAGDEIVALPPGDVEIGADHWDAAERKRTAATLPDAIEQLAYDCLEDAHGGWENNDGAFGEFAFDVAQRSITLDYIGRYVETDYSQHVF